MQQYPCRPNLENSSPPSMLFLCNTIMTAIACLGRFDSAPQPMTALVAIYFDASVLVTHGGLEVGQGKFCVATYNE